MITEVVEIIESYLAIVELIPGSVGVHIKSGWSKAYALV